MIWKRILSLFLAWIYVFGFLQPLAAMGPASFRVWQKPHRSFFPNLELRKQQYSHALLGLRAQSQDQKLKENIQFLLEAVRSFQVLERDHERASFLCSYRLAGEEKKLFISFPVKKNTDHQHFANPHKTSDRYSLRNLSKVEIAVETLPIVLPLLLADTPIPQTKKRSKNSKNETAILDRAQYGDFLITRPQETGKFSKPMRFAIEQSLNMGIPVEILFSKIKVEDWDGEYPLVTCFFEPLTNRIRILYNVHALAYGKTGLSLVDTQTATMLLSSLSDNMQKNPAASFAMQRQHILGQQPGGILGTLVVPGTKVIGSVSERGPPKDSAPIEKDFTAAKENFLKLFKNQKRKRPYSNPFIENSRTSSDVPPWVQLLHDTSLVLSRQASQHIDPTSSKYKAQIKGIEEPKKFISKTVLAVLKKVLSEHNLSEHVSAFTTGFTIDFTKKSFFSTLLSNIAGKLDELTASSPLAGNVQQFFISRFAYLFRAEVLKTLAPKTNKFNESFPIQSPMDLWNVATVAEIHSRHFAGLHHILENIDRLESALQDPHNAWFHEESKLYYGPPKKRAKIIPHRPQKLSDIETDPSKKDTDKNPPVYSFVFEDMFRDGETIQIHSEEKIDKNGTRNAHVKNLGTYYDIFMRLYLEFMDPERWTNPLTDAELAHLVKAVVRGNLEALPESILKKLQSQDRLFSKTRLLYGFTSLFFIVEPMRNHHSYLLHAAALELIMEGQLTWFDLLIDPAQTDEYRSKFLNEVANLKKGSHDIRHKTTQEKIDRIWKHQTAKRKNKILAPMVMQEAQQFSRAMYRDLAGSAHAVHAGLHKLEKLKDNPLYQKEEILFDAWNQMDARRANQDNLETRLWALAERFYPAQSNQQKKDWQLLRNAWQHELHSQDQQKEREETLQKWFKNDPKGRAYCSSFLSKKFSKTNPPPQFLEQLSQLSSGSRRYIFESNRKIINQLDWERLESMIESIKNQKGESFSVSEEQVQDILQLFESALEKSRVKNNRAIAAFDLYEESEDPEFSATVVDHNSQLVEVNVPSDNSCLFWSLALSTLMAHLFDPILFPRVYLRLFGSAESQNDVHNILLQFNATRAMSRQGSRILRPLIQRLRNRIVDYMQDSGNMFSGFIGNSSEERSRYFTDMRRPSSWGGEPELRAFSQMLEIRVNIYERDLSYVPQGARSQNDQLPNAITVRYINNSHYHFLFQQ